MPELMASAVTLAAEINRIASAVGGAPRDLMSLWDPLRRVLPFSAAWLGVLDTGDRRFLTAAQVGQEPPECASVESRAYFDEVQSSGIWQRRRPMCLQDGRPATCSCGDRLRWPAGEHDGLGVPLIATDGRPVGLLVLLDDTTGHPSDPVCEVIIEVAPMIAAVIDPMTTIIGLAGLVGDARASAVVGPDGAVHPLPGSPPHPVLGSGSPVVALASERLRIHRSPTAFLYPHPGPDPDSYLRVTAIACPPTAPSPYAELVIVSPPGDLHGLTRRELEVLGLVIDGATNRQIASALFIAERTVAAHLEHILVKLDVPSRTAAAVRSLELTLHIPPRPAGSG